MVSMKLEALAIGSLPHKSVDEAMALVKTFPVPFWPQMVALGEDMIAQFAPHLSADEDEFFAALEQLFEDYELRTTTNYAVDSLTFDSFLKLARGSKFAKGQIAGPFTVAAALTDKNGRSAIYDETLREVIVKTLALKALWQVEKIKAAGAVPIIFIDEPSMSHLGTSAFLTVSQPIVSAMIKEVSDIIKENGGITALHCCGKCDWTPLFDTGVDIINVDGFLYAQSLAFCASQLEKFLQRCGKIAWGIIPTLDPAALQTATLTQMVEVFERDVKYLTEKGIDEKIIIDNSLITTACGAGALTKELAQKALQLTGELSNKLKERYSDS